MDKALNQCKGYGFVDFESREAASRAVEMLTKNGIQAQMAKVSIALPLGSCNRTVPILSRKWFFHLILRLSSFSSKNRIRRTFTSRICPRILTSKCWRAH